MIIRGVSRGAIAALAAVVLAACSTVAQTEQSQTTATPSAGGKANTTYATMAQVLDAVKAAEALQTLPDSAAAVLAKPDTARVQRQFDCQPVDNPSNAELAGNCTYGDPTGSKLMVLYGDSHAAMWAATLEGVAKKSGWKLRVFAKYACPAPDLQFLDPISKTPNTKCDEFHSWAPATVKALHPDVLVVTSLSKLPLATRKEPSPDEVQQGWTTTLNNLVQPGTHLAMIGDLPYWNKNDSHCIAAHVNAIQECSASTSDATSSGYYDAEKASSSAVGVLYIPTIPWICADRCEPVVASTRVFNSPFHISQSYAVYLTGALNEALQPVLT